MFKVGDKIVLIKDCSDLAGVWKIPYPTKGEVYKVNGCRKHPIHDFYLITIDGFWQELCYKIFRKVDENFADETLEMIKEQIKEEQLTEVLV